MSDLSDTEKGYLDALEGKMTVVRDAVRGVAKEFHTGLILWGEGGTGKSWTVIDQLQAMRTNYVYHNSRLTGRGLVDSLGRMRSDTRPPRTPKRCSCLPITTRR
jgi:hypothetical protein